MAEARQDPNALKTPTPSTPKVRVALIGCGAIAKQMHLPIPANRPEFELAVVVNPKGGQTKEVAEQFKIASRTKNLQELNTNRAGAAVTATPPVHRGPAILAILEIGIHVLVEKPIASNTLGAKQLVDKGRQRSIALAVGFFQRDFPSINLLKSLISSRWAGDPGWVEVAGVGVYGWKATTLDNIRKELSGGGMHIDYGSHLINLVCALFDIPPRHLSYEDDALAGIEADFKLHVEFEKKRL